MGKRPRTPHFISGIGDGSLSDNSNNNNNKRNNNRQNNPNDDIFGLRGDASSYLRSRTERERLIRMEEAATAEHWKDVFGSGAEDAATGGIGRAVASSMTAGPWQVSIFAILGCVIILSAIFLHVVSDSSSEHGTHPYNYRRRQRQRRMYKNRKLQKKKTDEWSDDEEEQIVRNSASILAGNDSDDLEAGKSNLYSLYYQPPPPFGFSAQEHRQRRASKDPVTPPSIQAVSASRAAGGNYYHQGQTYHTPGNMSIPPRRQIGASNSFNSQTGSAAGMSTPINNGTPNHPSQHGPPSSRLSLPTPPDAYASSDGFNPSSAANSNNGIRLPTAPEGAQYLAQPSLLPGGTPGAVRPLNSSNFSSFASMEVGTDNDNDIYHGHGTGHVSAHDSPDVGQSLVCPDPSDSRWSTTSSQSNHDSHVGSVSRHRNSLILSPGNADLDLETPRVGNQRRTLTIDGSNRMAAPNLSGDPMRQDSGLMMPDGGDQGSVPIPFMPALDTRASGGLSIPQQRRQYRADVEPPRSVLLEELKLVQMETGSSTTEWGVKSESLHQSPPPRSGAASEQGDSDVSIQSGDPRKSIIHKRSNLTMATDAGRSLQSDIDFDELKLQEVIGGGGFGQVWRATWRGTPVAVKVLTGSAQTHHIAKAVLEEFKAEINLLKVRFMSIDVNRKVWLELIVPNFNCLAHTHTLPQGMRHPNICLYMGACVDPPNRAIITELAANGSVWDALRLPLMPPFVPADGTSRGCWPLHLYVGNHGVPPSDGAPKLSAPIPPKGTWPWELVKRVACGSARGMAYLHSGKPPVLHRDLKSANLLLDESYTTKVCDFGLSRLKAQERSMTGNCGTVQWMAPEVLANMNYNEKADVFSYGIILWELLSRECPYDGLSPIQCALAVLNRDKRPDIPKFCPPALHALIKACIKKDPEQRPSFEEILQAIDAME